MLPVIALLLACGGPPGGVHVVTVSAGGDGPSVATEAAGLTLHAQAALIEQIFPADDPRYQTHAAHHVARGWGNTRAEAARNASARLNRIRALERKQHEHALLQRYRSQSPDLQEDAERMVSDLFEQATHLSAVRVSEAETRAPGAATVRFSDPQCGDPVEVTAAVDGTGLDLLVDHACNQVLTPGLVMSFEATAHAPAQLKAELYQQGILLAEACQLRCLQGAVVD